MNLASSSIINNFVCIDKFYVNVFIIFCVLFGWNEINLSNKRMCCIRINKQFDR